MELSSSGVQNTPICYGVTGYFYTKFFQDWSPEIPIEATISVYSICIQIITILIQDTFITFSRPCEAVRQIEDDVLYLWIVPNKNYVNSNSFTLIPKLITKVRYNGRRAKFWKLIFGSNDKTNFINCTQVQKKMA